MKHIIKRLTDQATIPSSTSDHGNHGYDVIVCHFSPSCSKQRECSNCLKSSERGRCNLCHEPGHTIPRDKIWYEHAQGCCFDSMSMCIDLTTFLHIWCNHLIRQLLSRHLILQVNLAIVAVCVHNFFVKAPLLIRIGGCFAISLYCILYLTLALCL